MTEEGKVSYDEKTNGQLNAYDRMVEELAKKTVALKDRQTRNQEAIKVSADIAENLNSLSSQIIESAKAGKYQRDIAEIEILVEGIRRARNRVREIHADYVAESPMLKGEARGIASEVEMIGSMRKQLEAEAQRKARLAEESRLEREKRERRTAAAKKAAETRKKKAKAKAKPKAKPKAKAKSKK